MIRRFSRSHLLVSAAATILLFGGCASSPRTPEGAVAARAKLLQLQGNPSLASLAPIEIRDADIAVSAAEIPQKDADLTAHLVLVADQKVDIAEAWAQSRLYIEQRTDLARATEAARLDARTAEAASARNDASAARSAATAAQAQTSAAEAEAARARAATASAESATQAARNQTDLARLDTAAALSENADLQREIAELNAVPTERGLVLTLGDVLFATNSSELRGGTATDLDRLATFLTRYEDRSVLIEGHTDDVGTEASNQALSQRRAESVQAYLAGKGIAASRLSSAGKGELVPIAGNDSPTGRQQNRRVEVIITE